MKKLLTVVLVFAMVLSMSSVAFAKIASPQPSYDSGDTGPLAGTSTVTNANGDTVTTTTTTDGTKEVATVTKDGSETVTTTLSTSAANKATADAPYTTSEITATGSDETAPAVKVTVPAGASGGDAVVQVAVKNNSTKVVLKVKNADGTYSVVKKSAAGDKGPVAVVKGTQEFIVVENNRVFKDTNGAAWISEAADFVSSREIMIGETADEFRPYEPIDVSTMMTVLGRIDNSVTLEESMGKTWETAGNEWGEKNGYSTSGNMARSDMAVDFYKFAGSPSVTEADKAAVKAYADADGLSDAQITAFAWLIKNGIVEGVGGNRLGWDEVANRAQFGAMIQRYIRAIVK